MGEISNSKSQLEYNGYSLRKEEFSGQSGTLKKNITDFEYNIGDTLKLIGFITKDTSGVFSDTIFDTPEWSKIYTFQFEHTNRIVILLYHKIVDTIPGNEYERNLDDFENDLKYIRINNYQVLSLEDLLLLEKGDLELITDGIIITFDDGFNSNYSMAFPLLSQYEMPGNFFIVPEWIGTTELYDMAEVWLISEYLNNDGEKTVLISVLIQAHIHI